MTSIINQKGLENNLTTMDIENIASLVQSELQAIRQIINQNYSVIKNIKIRSSKYSHPAYKYF